MKNPIVLLLVGWGILAVVAEEARGEWQWDMPSEVGPAAGLDHPAEPPPVLDDSRPALVVPPPVSSLSPAAPTPAEAPLNLADWRRRRLVQAAATGIINIELDAWVLAACKSDLADLRLVHNDCQLPYLIKPGTVLRNLQPIVVQIDNDPQRLTVARWELTLPLVDLPVANLTVRSSARLFARRLIVSIRHQNDRGNAWSEDVAAADWAKSGDDDAPLLLNLSGRRMPRSFVLATDNGDNPPIPLEEIGVSFAAPSIIAKITDRTALFLYYDNPKAPAPRYDLRLVSTQLPASGQAPSPLGAEEILHTAPRERPPVETGSPWLWVALSGVVAMLLVIVAKLVPRLGS